MKALRNPGFFVLALLCLGSSLAMAQAANPSVQVRYDSTYGHYLVGPNGMTLYLFTNDEAGKSNCYDQCAINWPPLLIETEAVELSPMTIPGSFGITERTDGSKQVTYNGWPLYYWKNDAAVGDTTGQAVGNVWWIANLNPVVQVLQDDEHGPILVGPTGMTLYLYTKDEKGITNCYEKCAHNWPPLVGGFEPMAGYEAISGEGISGKLDVIKRADGSSQVTYNGIPLYYWLKDQVPGQTLGQNVGEVWFVLNP